MPDSSPLAISKIAEQSAASSVSYPSGSQVVEGHFGELDLLDPRVNGGATLSRRQGVEVRGLGKRGGLEVLLLDSLRDVLQVFLLHLLDFYSISSDVLNLIITAYQQNLQEAGGETYTNASAFMADRGHANSKRTSYYFPLVCPPS